MTEPLWRPSADRIANSNVTAFIEQVNESHGLALDGYDDLYNWSVTEVADFWKAVWDFCGVIAEGEREPALIDEDKMPGATFFPKVRLNFAENLLRVGPKDPRAGEDAMVFWGEDKVKRRLSWRELNDAVSRLQTALKAWGVKDGDRVAGFMPNMPETVIAMLATASLGAVWTSCSPDFGVQGVLDRFGQTEPKALFVPDGYFYNGKTIDSLPRVAEFAKELPSVEKIVVVPYIQPVIAAEDDSKPDKADLSVLDARAVHYADVLASHEGGAIDYKRMPFNAPLYIMYSSGTTGKPKCIVHGIGGALLQHMKEHQLQCDEKPGDRVFYFTTCGWMMWNWLVTALATPATLLLYDGSPFAPSGEILWDYAERERMTLFGTSAKYIDALKKFGVIPKAGRKLEHLKTLTSTGSPLVPEGFDYVYQTVKQDLCLSSISGGTDIISCFVGGNPIGPVWRGEIQARGLGMAVQVWDDEGKPVRGEKGELVCVKPFVSMPIYFWDDPTGERYRAAYFERYDNIWYHGDFMELTEHDGCIIYGRSDATLNPGGVRIGTAEIYRQVEKLPEVEESIVIGQDWEGDVRVVLFVKMRDGQELTDEIRDRIKKQVKEGATPRHVPAKILQVADIPRTKSGKIVELAVRDVVHGRAVKNKEALANPEALELYRDREELSS